jgi:hypothetical protein
MLLAIEFAERLRSDVVLLIAEKMGFTLDVTGVWCRTKTQGENYTQAKAANIATVRIPVSFQGVIKMTFASSSPLSPGI